MSTQLQIFANLLKSRLSRRITLWIFASIVTIEAILLIPSVYRRERELLQYLKEISAAKMSGLIQVGDIVDANPENFLFRLKTMPQNTVVKGGALYQADGTLVGVFGEAPLLSAEAIIANRRADRFDRGENRYEAAWFMSPLQDRYILIITHDATGVQAELYAFVGRIAGLVLIISLFVTLAMMIVLERMLISPIMVLRKDLLKAGDAGSQASKGAKPPEFGSIKRLRSDELGDVFSAFEHMFYQIYESIANYRESEARFRTLVEQAVDAFFVADFDGRLIDVNEQACRSLGYPREELLTLGVPDVQQKLTYQDLAGLWQQLTPDQPITVDGIHKRKDGTTFPVEVRLGLFQPPGRNKLVLALARDVSERKEAEKAMQRLAEIGELAAMIVHEVRNPLTTILMGLDFFNRMELSDRAKARLELAMDESVRLQRLLNEILLYAKSPKLQLVECDLNTFIAEMLEGLREMPWAMHRSIEFIPCATPTPVKVDRDKLKQVFINLVSNACEAIEPGETIRWQVFKALDARFLRVEVHNGGDPIPVDILPKLTQPFYTTKSSGNGLGLAITKRIAEAHGGELQIESSVEKGTTVTVFLPMC